MISESDPLPECGGCTEMIRGTAAFELKTTRDPKRSWKSLRTNQKE